MYIIEAPLKIVRAFEKAATEDPRAQKHVSIEAFEYPNGQKRTATVIFELKKLDAAQKRIFLNGVSKQYPTAKIR